MYQPRGILLFETSIIFAGLFPLYIQYMVIHKHVAVCDEKYTSEQK